MHTLILIPLIALVVTPAFANGGSIDQQGPAAVDRNEAQWADREAQARMMDGDYDGAVQAEQQAETDRQDADRQEVLARPAKR